MLHKKKQQFCKELIPSKKKTKANIHIGAKQKNRSGIARSVKGIYLQHHSLAKKHSI